MNNRKRALFYPIFLLMVIMIMASCHSSKGPNRAESPITPQDTATPATEKNKNSPAIQTSPSQEKEQYQFTINGKDTLPPFISMSGDEKFYHEGDLIYISYAYIPLGKPGKYNFEIINNKSESHKIYRILPDGSKILMNIFYSDEKRALLNLKSNEIRTLKNIYIYNWNDKLVQILKSIEPDTFITIESETNQGNVKSMPPIPNQIRYLEISNGSSDGIKDFSRLKSFNNLLYFSIRDMANDNFDIGLIQNSISLRYLNLSGQTLANPNLLGKFTSLRYLILYYSSESNYKNKIKDISFTSKMPELRHLVISNTAVEDLTCLSNHQKITDIDANDTGITKLPQGKLPALKRISLVKTPISEEEIARFKKENPDCQVLYKWNQALQETLSGADRIDICEARADSSSKPLFSEKNKKDINNLIAAIEIDEEQSGFHCMCDGSPWIRFYKNNKEIGVVSMHHGRSLRWSGWPGDGMMTDKCADFVNNWLAARNAKGPLAERNMEKRQEKAQEDKISLYKKLIPINILNKLAQTSDMESGAKAFEDNIPDESEKIQLYLRLYGVSESAWNVMGGDPIESMSGTILLPKHSDKAIVTTISKWTKDPLLMTGAAKWLFRDQKWKSLDKSLLAKIIDPVSRNALANPTKINRWIVFNALSDMGQGKSTTIILRDVFKGKISIRKVPESLMIDEGGYVVYTQGQGEITEDSSDRAYAAYLLLKFKDRESYKAIREFTSKASKEDKAVLQQAYKTFKIPL